MGGAYNREVQDIHNTVDSFSCNRRHTTQYTRHVYTTPGSKTGWCDGACDGTKERARHNLGHNWTWVALAAWRERWCIWVRAREGRGGRAHEDRAEREEELGALCGNEGGGELLFRHGGSGSGMGGGVGEIWGESCTCSGRTPGDFTCLRCRGLSDFLPLYIFVQNAHF